MAPLKLDQLRLDLAGELAFPRLQKRGPIEARTGERPQQERQSFHAYKSVAPLKPLEEAVAYAMGAIVSTLTKAWPH